MDKLIESPSGHAIVMPGTVAPALCLDLDGTIRYSKSGKFIAGPDDIALFEGVEAKIWEYRDKGYFVFGISNQGGVAHGFKTVEDDDREIQATIALFQRNPFHLIKCSFSMEGGKVSPYNYRSLLRKPQIGMLAWCEVTIREFDCVVDWDKSLMVGDRPEDMQLAENARIQFAWAWQFFGREKPADAREIAFDGDPKAKTVVDLITAKQIWMIRSLGRDNGIDVDKESHTQFQSNLEELSKRAGSALIEHLKRKAGQ